MIPVGFLAMAQAKGLAEDQGVVGI